MAKIVKAQKCPCCGGSVTASEIITEPPKICTDEEWAESVNIAVSNGTLVDSMIPSVDKHQDDLRWCLFAVEHFKNRRIKPMAKSGDRSTIIGRHKKEKTNG